MAADVEDSNVAATATIKRHNKPMVVGGEGACVSLRDGGFTATTSYRLFSIMWPNPNPKFERSTV
jgi:hypothetical protein